MEPTEDAAPRRPGQPHGFSKLSAGTKKLAAKLGLKSKRDRSRGGSPTHPGSTASAGTGGSSPAPASPLGAAVPGLSPVSPGFFEEEAVPVAAPMAPATPAGHLEPEQQLGTPRVPARVAVASPLEEGIASHVFRAPDSPRSPARDSPESELASHRQRLARLRAAAEHATHADVAPGRTTAGEGPIGPAAAMKGPLQGQMPGPPAVAAYSSPAQRTGREEAAAQPRRRVQAAAVPTPPGAPRLHEAPSPLAPAQPSAPRPARAEQEDEQEGLALYRPASEETRRGRLSAAVATASPYLAPPPPIDYAQSPAEEAAAAEAAAPPASTQLGPPPEDNWRVAAERPVAAVGGTTGQTHVGGRAELAAARLHTGDAAAAPAETAAADEVPTEEQLVTGEQPGGLSPVDLLHGRGLAAADAAPGRKAARDAASAADEPAAPPEPVHSGQMAATAVHHPERPHVAAERLPAASGGWEEGARESAAVASAEQSPPLGEEEQVAAAATVTPQALRGEEHLAAASARGDPERQEQGPFGAQMGRGEISREGSGDVDVPRGPVSLDRRTESEAVVVEELAERMQAATGSGGETQLATPSPAPPQRSVPALSLPSSSEGPEPLASPTAPLESDLPSHAGGAGASVAGQAEPSEGRESQALPSEAGPAPLAAEPAAGARPVDASSGPQLGHGRAEGEEPPAEPPSGAELEEALQTASLPGVQVEQGDESGERGTLGTASPTAGAEQQPQEEELESAAEAPVTATVARGAADAAAGTAAAARQAAATGAEKVVQAGTAAKEAVQGAGASAAAAARATAQRFAAAVSPPAAPAEAAASPAEQPPEAEAAAGEGEEAAAGKDVGSDRAPDLAEQQGVPSMEATSTTAPEEAGEAAEEEGEGPKAAAQAVQERSVGGQAGEEQEELAAADEQVSPQPPVEEPGQSPQGGGLAASLLGAAAHAVHAVQEQLHSVYEHGRQLAAEHDAQMEPGGGDETRGVSAAAPPLEGRQEGEAGGGASGEMVPPASTSPESEGVEEAVEQQPEVGSKQATTPAPSDLASGPAAPPSSSPRAGGAVVLPVAVGEADKQSVAAAAASSPAVDASLEAEQEVPEVAAAQQGQPEGLDAPPEYLAERGAAKEREGLPGAGAADEGRLRFEDLSGLEALGSPRAAATARPPGAAAPGVPGEGVQEEQGPEDFEELVEDLEHYMKDEPLEHDEMHQRRKEEGSEEARTPAASEAPNVAGVRQTVGQQSMGGLREPPPSPSTSSPPGGAPGDVAAPASVATAGGPKGPSRLQTSTTMGSSVEVEEMPAVEDVALQAVTPADRAMLLLMRGVDWARRNPTRTAATAAALVVLWLVLSRAAFAVFGDFGPVLVLSGAIALGASLVTWFVRLAGVPKSEFEMLSTQATEAQGGAGSSSGGAAAAAAPLPPNARSGEEAAAMDRSEPVSKESTQDLRKGGGPGGVVQAARDTAAEATEEVLAAVQPGREQVGEVIQETESGEEEVADEDPVSSVVQAVTGVAKAAAHGVESLVDRAYQALSREAPGADVTGEGAPLKGLEQETLGAGGAPEASAGGRGLEPAAPEAAAAPPAPPPAGTNTAGESGYDSDSDKPGAVLEGVHPARGQDDAGLPAGTVEPTLGGEAQPGMLARAAEVGHEAASAAAGAVKHAAAVATGTAAEQKDPAQQLEDVYRSIQDMERERAGDASFQAASKKLGN